MRQSPSAGWVSGAGRPAGAPQQAPGHPHTSHETTNMARSQAGEGPAQTALGRWQHGPVHSHSNAQVREDCKVLQPSTTSILKDTTHRGSSGNLPDPIRSHLLLRQVLHHWQQSKACFSSRAFHNQLHLCVPLANPPLFPVISATPHTPLPLAITVPVSFLVPSPTHHLPRGRFQRVPLEPPCPSCQGKNLLSNPHMHFILNSKCPVPGFWQGRTSDQLVPCLFCPQPRENLNVTGNTKGLSDN